MTFMVVDTETTGFDPKVERVVEIAWILCCPKQVFSRAHTRVNPGIPIPAVASAVHHIIDEDVVGCPALHEIAPTIELLAENGCMVAHNAAFDRGFLASLRLPTKWLCTMRLARHLWPEAPSHSNQALRYCLKLPVPRDLPAHSALADAEVTAALFQREMAEYVSRFPDSNLDQLLAYIETPCLVRTMTFGKHAGKPVADLPLDYVDWALRNVTDMDSDLRYTLKERLKPARVVA